MKKKILVTGGIIAVICIILVFFLLGHFYDLQYNDKKVSRGIGITIDESGWDTLCQSDGITYRTYNLDAPVLITVAGDEILLGEAIKSGKTNMEDLCKYPSDAKETTFKGETGTAYIFENYQIVVVKDECIISPLDVVLE